MVPEPAPMHVHGVGAVEEVLQAGFHGRPKTRPHPEAAPASFAILRKLERRGFRDRFTRRNPHVSIVLPDGIRSHPAIRQPLARAERWNLNATTSAIKRPPVVRTGHTTRRHGA